MNIFEITIREKQGDSCPVVVEYEEQQVRNQYKSLLTLTEDDLRELKLLLWEPNKKYGQLLGKKLFIENIKTAFQSALRSISNPNPGNNHCLHVLLHIEDQKLRQELRWEKLCAPYDTDNWDYLLLNQKTPLSLYIPTTTDNFPPVAPIDLKALVVVASPEGLGKYQLESFDVQSMVSSIKASLGDIPCDVLATVDGALGLPTLKELIKCLTKNDKYYNLLHLICHGKLLDNGETVIYLADENNQVKPVKATELIEELGRSHRLPHFAFLSICESASLKAQLGEVEALGGLAQRLISQLGMLAVVAMTERISIDTAQALATNFYHKLMQHGYVDLALVEATAGLQNRQDITVPVLFSRLRGRPLFK